MTRNTECKPVTAKIVCDEIEAVSGVTHNVRTMRRTLYKMGMRFIQGHKRNILAEKDVNVAFRANYFTKVMVNRNGDNNPINPEVFLDESYCNFNHVSGKTWVDEASKAAQRAVAGKGEAR